MLTPKQEDLNGIIMEFKVTKSNDNETTGKIFRRAVQTALEQINAMKYNENLLTHGISKERIFHYGFAFCGKRVLAGKESIEGVEIPDLDSETEDRNSPGAKASNAF